MKGRALALSTAAKPIKRKTAEARLNEFLERVHEVNKNEQFIYREKRAWVFGSYFSDASDLGDVDIAPSNWLPKNIQRILQELLIKRLIRPMKMVGVFQVYSSKRSGSKKKSGSN